VAEKFTAGYWRMRAEEARTFAEEMHDPTARHTMLGIAAGYEQLATAGEKLDQDTIRDQNSTVGVN